MTNLPATLGPNPKHSVTIELLVATCGDRFRAKPGERRTILWPKASRRVPSAVQRARAGEPIDWGGQLVPASCYRIVSDTQAVRTGSADDGAG